MNIKIYYGLKENNIDVTDICLSILTANNIINIPCGDINRATHFSDPLPGIQKNIIIINNDILYEYEQYYMIKINLSNNTISAISENDINNKIEHIHSTLKIKYGYLNEELPEQKMVVRYLTGKENVLEIGANIGRNSLMIASILENNNFVTLESNPDIKNLLIENRDLNNLNFHVEDSALSNRKLIQRGWQTIPSDTLYPEYDWVKTITFNQLKSKYNIQFDTLVLDCEGAFYYILIDMPEILDNIKLIIMENDYFDLSQKQYINDVLIKNNFYRDYVESGGWGPCSDFFYEVWKKML